MSETAHAFVDAALEALRDAVHDRECELRTLQLATVSPERRPAVRSVVLRAFDPAARTLEFHADARSDKLRDLAALPHASLLAWSERRKLQVRLDGDATLHLGDAVASGVWDGLSESARTAYAFVPRPGDPIEDPQSPPRTDDDGSRFARFAVIRIALVRIDVLRLDGDAGQRRAIRHHGRDPESAFVCP